MHLVLKDVITVNVCIIIIDLALRLEQKLKYNILYISGSQSGRYCPQGVNGGQWRLTSAQ